MKERIRKSILAILAAVALIATLGCLYSAEYIGGLACAVVLASVVFDLFDPHRKTDETTNEFSPRLQKELDRMIRLRPYKIPKKVIEYYNEEYPYLVVAENPISNAVEYWWASDKDVECLEHSCIADKYVQLGHCIMSEPVKEEAHGDEA